MTNWKALFGKSASAIEDHWDELRNGFKQKLKLHDPVQILPYRTYGTARRLYIKGRVLEDKKIASAGDKDTILNNLLNMYKRFESDEVKGATIKVRLADEEHEVVTDKEGYFVLDLNPITPVINEQLWHPIPLELVHAPIPFDKNLQAMAEVMIPPPDAEYGIISDIDDTIIKTTATNLLAMSRTTFLNNAKTRLPFAGVAEFYNALQVGRNGKRNNPFFYVSSSEWNLYDYLQEFRRVHELPHGIFLLNVLKRFKGLLKTGQNNHQTKFTRIVRIIEGFPKQRFVLLGDSSQHDPYIYEAVVKHFPKQIHAVYIRDVYAKNKDKVKDVLYKIEAAGVPCCFFGHSSEAILHSKKIGLITEKDVIAQTELVTD